MFNFALVMMGLGLLGLLAGMFMLYRNRWVYDTRMKVLDEDFLNFGNLPSYDYMMYHFWIWDVETFMEGERR